MTASSSARSVRAVTAGPADAADTRAPETDVPDTGAPDSASDGASDGASGGGAGQGPQDAPDGAAPDIAPDIAPDTASGKASRGNRAAGKAAQIEARRASAVAAKAEAQAALQARREARSLALTQKTERNLAKLEAQAAREEAIRTAAPPVRQARPKARHYAILTSFIFLVVLPAALTGWYLWERATDQYASYVGFSVRTEEQGSSIESLFGIPDLSGSSSSDTDILYEFLQSQQLVAKVDAKLDLRELWSRPGKAADPIFAYDPPGTIEDLTKHWSRKVKVYYDSNSGLIDLRVLAFDPLEAQQIAELIYEESSAMINQLSAIAREDAIGYARDELEQVKEELKQARLELQVFRNRTQIIDPALQGQTQSGLIGALESELANAQIDLQLLRKTARDNDPRIAQTELRVAAIKQQISDERSELGLESATANASVADLVGQYEELAVDLEFAQQAYTAARAAYDSARNEARRQSRYLAAHVPPTLAEKSQYPDRESTMALVTVFLLLAWAFLVLAAYAMRDRR